MLRFTRMSGAALVVATLLPLLLACQRDLPQKGGAVGNRTGVQSQAGGRSAGAVVPNRRGGSQSSAGSIRGFSIVGTGRFARKPNDDRRTGGRSIIPVQDDRVVLNFDNVDIKAFAEAIFGSLLKVNYSVHPTLRGRISMRTAQPIERIDVLRVVERVLLMNGVSVVSSKNLYQLVPVSGARRASGGASAGSQRPIAVGHAVSVIPLRHLSPNRVQALLRQFVPANVRFQVDGDRNILLVAASQTDLEGIQNLLRTLDVDRMRGMSFGLYPLHRAEASKVVRELEQVFRVGRTRSPIVRFVGIERMNAVLVISKRPGYLARARRWIARLDQGGQDAVRLHVYFVRNRRANELATLLRQIYGRNAIRVGSVGGPGTANNENRAGDTRTPNARRPNTGQTGASNARRGTGPTRRTNPPAGNNRVQRTDPAIQIIADDSSNSLLIRASGAQYERIRRAIVQLDVLARQVLVEATILEVTLNNTLQFGVRWFFQKGQHRGAVEGPIQINLSPATALPGFSYLFNAVNVQIAINALRRITDVKVISSPSLMVLDNKTARLQVGDEVPVATQSAVSVTTPGAPIVNSIEFRNTGVILAVKPRINPGGLVTLDIEQEVSDVADTTTSQIDSPTIRQRKIKSIVTVQSGQTIALGGLIRDTRNRTSSGIPIISRAPIIGNLFKNQERVSNRTELIVLLRPIVISSRSQVRGITDEMRRKIRNLNANPHRPWRLLRRKRPKSRR